MVSKRHYLSRWLRFFEVYMPDGVLPVLVGLAMAWTPGSGDEFWIRGPLFMLFVYSALLFVHGSDSIVGYMKGVDQLVYEQNGAVKHEKLLVTGELTLMEAVIGTGLMLALVVGLAIFFAVTAVWPVALMGVATLLFTSQYSVGLRWSYLGLGEAVIAATGLGTPVAHGFVTGQLSGAACMVGISLGLLHAAANINSNQADYPFDRAAGRGTLAVRLGLERHRHVGVALIVAGWAMFLGALVTGGLPIYAAVALGLVYRNIQQVQVLYGGDPIAARRIAFGMFRAMVWIIIGAILLSHAVEMLRA